MTTHPTATPDEGDAPRPDASEDQSRDDRSPDDRHRDDRSADDSDVDGASDRSVPDRREQGDRAITPSGTGRRPPPRRTGVFVDADDLRSHVGELLRAILGGYQVDPFGNYSFTHHGARVYVSIGATPVGLAVNVHSVTNIGLELDEALAAYIATTNHRLGFGALSWDADNDAVWLRHTVLGTTLDAPELQAAVATVAQTAAAVDDDIKQRFGGRTFDEAPADVRAATAPPRPGGGPAGEDDDGDASAPDDVGSVAADNASGYL